MKPPVAFQIPESKLQISDADLLSSVAAGDENALIELYDSHRRILFGLIIRILRNHAEAEDVLQEVFVQIWKQAGAFDQSRGKAVTWLATIARSRAIDRLRLLGSRERTVQQATAQTIELTSNAIEDAICSRRSKLVRAALRELPEEQRKLLLMAYFEGHSQSEIAERTKTPLGTVKTRIRDGMTKLRVNLNSDLPHFL